MDKKVLIALIVIILGVIVFFVFTSQREQPQDLSGTQLSECKTDSDCQPNQSCECTQIIPDCEGCQGGKCVFECVDN